MRKVIVFTFFTILLNGCVVYEQRGRYVAASGEYKSSLSVVGSSVPSISVPISHKNGYKSLDFSFNNLGEVKTVSTILFIPIQSQTRGKNISVDNKQVHLRVLNTNKYDNDALSNLNFSLVVNGRSYRGQQRIAPTLRASDDGSLVFYDFPISAKDMSGNALVIVEYKGIRKEVPIVFDTSWKMITH